TAMRVLSSALLLVALVFVDPAAPATVLLALLAGGLGGFLSGRAAPPLPNGSTAGMPLVSGLDVLGPARADGYAVGAFNTNDMEVTQAIVWAAEATRSPVIVSLSEGALRFGGDALVAVVKHLADRATVPVAMHLDHGSSYAMCVRALRWGFTSVMIDMSHADEETNVRETARVVEAAH